MALGAVLAAALTDHSVRTKLLTIGGTDVLKQPGQTGMGTPIASVRVTEIGPPGVSSMTFTIEDPQLTVAVSDGMEIRFFDIAADLPIFTGWIESFSAIPAFGDTGRVFVVNAVGPESILDWALLPNDVVLPVGMLARDAVLALAGQAVGTGPLRAISSAAGLSSQAAPVDSMAGVTIQATITVTAGTTLREGIRQAIAVLPVWITPGFYETVTVDFWYGLRVYLQDVTRAVTSDYTVLTMSNNVTPGLPTEGLTYTVEGSHVRGVYIKGVGAGSLFMDGTGLMGDIAYLSDPTITTAAQMALVASAYLAPYATVLRGTFRREDIAYPANFHAGSQIAITNENRIGPFASQFITGSITRTFNPSGRENLGISFGGLPPSAMALVRRLTRSTLS